ncbi:MAG: hypothetical protein AB1490_04660 [Pseudomonadota bacterium]
MAIPDSTYGQRPGLITRQSLQAIQGAPEEYGESFGSAIWGQWRGVFAGLAVICVVVGGYFAMNKSAVRVFDRFWNDASALPGIEDAYKRSGLGDGIAKDLLLEQVHSECRARSEYIGRSQPRKADAGPADSFTLAKQVTYLTCIASERPHRFCQAGHRSHLLMAVRDYYKLMGRMRDERMASTAGIVDAAPLQAADSDPRVLNALKALVLKGYVARRDLVGAASGWPNDLEAGLGSVDPKQRGCG